MRLWEALKLYLVETSSKGTGVVIYYVPKQESDPLTSVLPIPTKTSVEQVPGSIDRPGLLHWDSIITASRILTRLRANEKRM
jgi:hypothetical protein